MIKTGAMHTASLRDGRRVFIDGAEAGDVTVHPAFRRTVQSVAKLYDFQSRPENRDLMTYETEDGGRANRMWQLPRTYEDLIARRQALVAWSELHGGYLGRSPDHVASSLSGMMMGLPVFQAYDPARAAALADYYRYVRDNDLYMTYVIINPQADRSKQAHEQADPYLTAGVVDQDAGGITVRGAKMLGTGGIIANEVMVTCIQPLQKGDERYAISFAVPINAPGVKLLSRKSYEAASPHVFDNPLASRFDENDAVIYFDDVKVPWDRVFVNQDIAMTAAQFHETPAHVYQNYQAQIRLMVKMRFLMGVARKIAETNGIVNFPQVRETLGHMAAQASMVEAFVHGLEAKGQMVNGYYVPDRALLYAAQVLTQSGYNTFVGQLRDLAGGGMIMLPSGLEDFADPELRRLIGKTQASPTTDAEGRVKFFKLAWDAVGSEFASRHTQYEMFYAGATFVTKNHAYRTFDWAGATGLVDRMLDSYSLDSELATLKH